MNFISHFILFSAVGFGLTPASFAFMPCPKDLHKSALAEDRLKTMVAIIGPKDMRQTYEEYWQKAQKDEPRLTLQDVYNKFRANGRVYCEPDNSSTGNVTLSEALVTGAAHAFYNENCTPKFTSLKQCKFYTYTGPDSVEEHDIEKVEVGTKCPKGKLEEDDWAVIRLKKRIRNVRPYLGADDCELRPGKSALNFGAPTINFRPPTHPPWVQKCVVVEREINAPRMSRTTCSNGGGGSGGAFACEVGENMALGGIVVESKTSNAYNYTPYSAENNSKVIPFTGKFRQMADRMLSGR